MAEVIGKARSTVVMSIDTLRAKWQFHDVEELLPAQLAARSGPVVMTVCRIRKRALREIDTPGHQDEVVVNPTKLLTGTRRKIDSLLNTRADGLPQLQRMVVSPAPRTCSSWGKVESSRDESVFEFLARPEVDLRGDTGKWLDLTF